jgi:hypothetical protein
MKPFPIKNVYNNMRTDAEKKKIKSLRDKIKLWDKLAEDNENNKHNLSTSERQDWLDELKDIKLCGL